MRTKYTLPILFLCTLFCVSLVSAQSFKSSDSKQLAENNIEAAIEEDFNTINKWDYFMYPVPASTELNVKITRGQVNISQLIITNEQGDEVISFGDQSIDRMKIDLSDLKPGKYFIRIITDAYSTPKMKRFYVSK